MDHAPTPRVLDPHEIALADLRAAIATLRYRDYAGHRVMLSSGGGSVMEAETHHWAWAFPREGVVIEGRHYPFPTVRDWDSPADLDRAASVVLAAFHAVAGPNGCPVCHGH